MATWSNVGSIKGPQGAQGPQGATGPQGPAGTNGTNGARGSQIYTGNGAPGTIAGALAGDQYLDLTSGNWYTYA